METKKLYDILEETTQIYRKGELIEQRVSRGVEVTEIYGYPASSTAPTAPNLETVDMVFIDVLVDRNKASAYKAELESILSQYPEPERLAGGPSYIELSPNLGLEQEGGLRLMALGKTLGLWSIVSGKSFGMDDNQARMLAGQGLLNISGYKHA